MVASWRLIIVGIFSPISTVTAKRLIDICARTISSYARVHLKIGVYSDWVRFALGELYCSEEKILFYSKEFYKRLMSYVDYHQIPSEAHIIDARYIQYLRIILRKRQGGSVVGRYTVLFY